MKKVFLIMAIFACLNAKNQTIVFSAGCFWGVEKYFENKKGVLDAISGYAGGNYPNPNYNQVLKYRYDTSKGMINHTESVKVVFDDEQISSLELIKSFWELHDPTQGNRQGNDIGNNYRSGVFYTNETQHQEIISTKKIYEKLLKKEGFSSITTQINKLDKFYEAKEFHQDYLVKNPNGYCPNHSTGVKFAKNDIKSDYIYPQKGKEIIVIKALYCPYCEKFEQNIASKYKGTISLKMAFEEQLKNFKIKSKIVGTPMILFIKNGVEISSHIGYLSKKDFYKKLGLFKLGKNTKAYDIAFDNGTEGQFCKQYDLFKHTGEGVFIDKVSGDILFDTKHRFDSKSGWLSFYKAVDGATIEIRDDSYGMKRIEIRAKNSGIHLGHVFPMSDGKRRFCINANVLEFVSKDDISK
jgi:peptide methionine sulfoxide reductase msrA/msrB